MKKFPPQKFAQKVDVEKVLKDLVDKHNMLATSFNGSLEQYNGVLSELNKNLETLNAKNQYLSTQVKTAMFHINKVNVESAALRKFLASKDIDFTGFKELADEMLRADFAVDTDCVPVGTVTVTYYN